MEELGSKRTPDELSNRVSTVPRATLDSASLTSLTISSLLAAAISWLPYEEDAGGNRVPTIIFKGQLYSFQSFVILILFGFSTSISAVYSYNRPKLGRVLRSCSIVCLSSAAAVLLFAVCRGSASKTLSSSAA